MIDLNFYPEKHIDELKGLTDIAVPEGWLLGDLVRELYCAKLDLWSALNRVDDDGNVVPTWK